MVNCINDGRKRRRKRKNFHIVRPAKFLRLARAGSSLINCTGRTSFFVFPSHELPFDTFVVETIRTGFTELSASRRWTDRKKLYTSILLIQVGHYLLVFI